MIQGPAGTTVDSGRVAVPAFPGVGDLNLGASFGPPGGQVDAALEVQVQAIGTGAADDAWPMFQGDPAHTGYRAMTLHPEMFVPKWAKTLAPLPLNPVAVAEGLVFCTAIFNGGNPGTTLFALDAESGETLWSRNFGASAVNTVNPPAYAHGLVYVQTCRGQLDSWLWGFDARTGEPFFRSRFETQFTRHYAPTIKGRKVVINGGQYGGIYQYDGLEGLEDWFTPHLPQYDQWTPAVNETHAYAYLGIYAPGLYAVDLQSGAVDYFVADPSFSGYTYSLNSAPVLGDRNDLIVVNSGFRTGRLLRFDLPSRTLSWAVAGNFQGQPSVARGVIYAHDGGVLKAFDQLTLAELWSWAPPAGSLSRPIVVTDSHAFVSGTNAVYAINLTTHQSEWSYPAPGDIALTKDCLYIATPFGTLHAISLHDQATATVLSRFEAEPVTGAVRIRWQFERPEDVARVRIERDIAKEGGWRVLEAEVLDEEGGAASVLDGDVEPGATYAYRLIAAFRDGRDQVFGPVHVTTPAASPTVHLDPPAPNPAREKVVLSWTQPHRSMVRMGVLDVQGRWVATLAEGPFEPGRHQVSAPLSGKLQAGLYFLVLEAEGSRSTRRLLISR
jgi:outer membrane protein assembly factor BamB